MRGVAQCLHNSSSLYAIRHAFLVLVWLHRRVISLISFMCILFLFHLCRAFYQFPPCVHEEDLIKHFLLLNFCIMPQNRGAYEGGST